MVGDIQEPLRHSFQGDYFHSGSISFGRYETEALCWERRSSFSHNRYLEEVERCSKPGSVTEKKAYFEAHFKKKALLSKITDSQNRREDENSQIMPNEDNKIEHHNEEIHTAGYDKNLPHPVPDQSHTIDYGLGCSECLGADNEHSFDTLNMVEKMVHEEVLIEGGELGSASILGEPKNEMKEILTGYGEAEASKKPSKSHRIHVNCEKDSATKVKTWSAATAMRSVSGTLKTLASRIPKIKVHENKSFLLQKKESTAKSTVTSRPSTTERDGPRPQQMAIRHMKSVSSTQPNLKQNGSSFGFSSDQRAERRKELEEKMLARETKAQQVKAKKQEKTEADMKQLRKSLSFKATPMPSFYTEARRSLDKSKVVAANHQTSKPQNKPPSPGAGSFKRSLSCHQSMRGQEACFTSRYGETSHPGSVSSNNNRNADSNRAAADKALISKPGHKKVISENVQSNRVLESKQVSSGRKMEGVHKVGDAAGRNGMLRTRPSSLAVGVA